MVYLDDVLLYSKALQDHRLDVSNILEAIRKSGMKIKPSKCKFHQKEIKYLGFIIREDGKTQAIWDWTTPKSKNDIQSVLGFCNSYRRFIEGFSRKAKPLYQHAEKKYDGKWKWGR